MFEKLPWSRRLLHCCMKLIGRGDEKVRGGKGVRRGVGLRRERG